MLVSEARLVSNQRNSTLAKGSLSPETRAISARNSFKHGLSGAGVVVSEADREEIQRRVEAFTTDMKPRSPAGVILIWQMARFSVRMERAAEHESAAIARNVRHAADDFDEERIDRAKTLFEGLGENPRTNLRRLKKMPEGVERLIDEWRDLRNDLAANPSPVWTASQLEQAANMTGLKAQHARASRLGALSRGFWGDFEALGEGEGGDLDETFRKDWAKAQLLERIDAEIAALVAHYETLDFKTIALDRAEAAQRALFDASKQAALARRYEAEASRGFFKALKEFRQVEAESDALTGSSPTPPITGPTDAAVGSFREMTPALDREPVQVNPDVRPTPIPTVRRPVPQPNRRTRRPKLPR